MIKVINDTETEIILMSQLLREKSTGQNEYTIPLVNLRAWSQDATVLSEIANGNVLVEKNGDLASSVSDAIDILKESIPKKVNSLAEPFANKTLSDGKKVFKRVHGAQKTLTTANEVIDFTIPYTQAKITGLEIIGANIGDTADFNVYDNSAGTISGVAGAKLNQFGFAVNMAKDFHREDSTYDADLIQGMKLEVDYTGTANQLICVNFILHEVK